MALKVDGLGKSFGDVSVLNDVSFEISPKESLAITGASGCGKSTLLHILGTLDVPSAGCVGIDGEDPFALSEPDLAKFRNQEIGFVFQDHHLLPQYSVLENVLIPTLAFGGASLEQEARLLIDRVGLGHRVDHRPAQLSGGERQRTAVARALINKPSLLLCDEPTGSLDGARAEEIVDLLFELHVQAGNVLIGVTHSLHIAARFLRRFELQEGTCVEV
ncbi:MAG: ABC transporter ATP-binding protein [Candidatus Latescibacteria bacterium]|jgi:lipoprotein-releasing system ATP-binding protein|nr:ABC transporter ATP-binding protein [Candidatus Latescibacterota bacterium]MBT5829896.1 ABC transporter ATP-binding protein [Candidatus Latescibacterota bacterium]